MTEVRTFSGHRMVSDERGDDRCLGCGWNGVGRIVECRPGVPRCIECRELPADVTEFIAGERFDYCAACRVGLRVPRVYRCPWCETPVHDGQDATDRGRQRWHTGCLADVAAAGYEVEA